MAKRKRKIHIARTPEAVAKYKQMFLDQLERGRSPGIAARNVEVSRRAVYNWKKEDREFDLAWRDAVETGLDALETQLYDSAMAGNSSDAQFSLKYRRYGGDGGKPQSNFILNITLQEHVQRLQRLGLPVPQIESDLEEDDEEQNGASEVD